MAPQKKKPKDQNTHGGLFLQNLALGASFEIFLPEGWRASKTAASTVKKSRPKKRRPAKRRKQ